MEHMEVCPYWELNIEKSMSRCHTPKPRTAETFWGGGRHVQYHNTVNVNKQTTSSIALNI